MSYHYGTDISLESSKPGPSPLCGGLASLLAIDAAEMMDSLWGGKEEINYG